MLYGELNTITLEDGSTVKGIRVKIQSPSKSAILRVPTAKELRAMNVKYEDRERKKNPSTDARPHQELFNSCRIDTNGDAFDQYEAEYAINQLCAFTRTSEMVDNGFVVTVKTRFNDITLTLRLPSLKELHEVETNPNLKKYLAMFDQLLISAEGFAPDYEVTDNQKTAALNDLLTYIKSFDAVEVDPN